MAQTYNPTLLEKGLKALFLQEMAGFEGTDLVQLLATVVNSSANNEKYAWMGQAPQMQDITDQGEVRFESMSDTGYTITNRLFASGIAVERQDLEDDQLGGIPLRIRELVAVAQRHRNKLIIDALINGTSATLGLGYDGVAMFHDSHPARNKEGGTQDNLLGGTGITTAQFQADLNSAVAAMANFKAENGEPFHEDISTVRVVAPYALRKPILEALQLNLAPDRTSAQLEGLNVIPVFSARLVDANDWYLLNVGGVVRPLIFQDRSPIEFTGLEGDSDTGFLKEQYLYKVRARYNVGYGPWQHAVKMVNS